MQKIQSFNTILYCEKFQECIHFYGNILELAVNFSHADWLIEFRINDGVCISIADAKKCTIDSAKGKGITVTLCVEHLLASQQELSNKGIETGKICTSEWRDSWFYIFDPEGNRIEIWEKLNI